VSFRRLTARGKAILIAAIGAGLFLSHTLSEFVPDALGIGLGMFCCGFVGGVLYVRVWLR
jgi:hypothetical protein